MTRILHRQTKGPYATYALGKLAGRGIKNHDPVLQVAAYDGEERANTVIELP